MLFITHDLSVLAEVSDVIAVMYAGRIIEEGPAEHVFHSARCTRTRRRSRPRSPRSATLGSAGKPEGLGGDPPDPQAIPEGCPFHPRCPEAWDDCTRIVPELWDAGRGGRRAACLLAAGRSTTSEAARRVSDDDAVASEPPAHRVGAAGHRGPRTSMVNFAGRVGLIAGLMGKKAADAKAVAGVNLTLREGEVHGACRGVGMREDHDRARDHGADQPAGGARCSTEGEPLGRNLKAYRREVQMMFQDPTAALNPRQTIYEMRGGRARGSTASTAGPNGETEEQLVARALSRAGLRPPERFYLLYPARAVRRTASARGDRGRAGAGAEGHRGGRAGVQPRRLGARRDPRPADEAPARAQTVDPDRHARPGARVDRGRPSRR